MSIDNEIKIRLEKIYKNMGLVDISSHFRKSRIRDYQIAEIIKFAYRNEKNPLILAYEIKKELENNSFFNDIIVVEPGYIHFNVSKSYVMSYLSSKHYKQHDIFKNILIDYGGPNIAKELHIGHLRSAILGSSLVHLCEYYGISVLTDVHLGDYGYNIGLVLAEFEYRNIDIVRSRRILKDDNSFIFRCYVSANRRKKGNEEFDKKARFISSQLNKNPYYNQLWQIIKEYSLNYIKDIYKKINVKFDFWYGESDSIDFIQTVFRLINEYIGIYQKNGALMVKNNIGNEIVLQKSDGAFLYASTELATMYKRVQAFNLDEIWYTVDYRQKQHFENVFSIAAHSIICDYELQNVFVGFETVHSNNNKPIKSRTGNTFALTVFFQNLYSDFNMVSKCRNKNDNLDISTSEKINANVRFRILSVSRKRKILVNYDSFLLEKGYSGVYIIKTLKNINEYLNNKNLSFEYPISIDDIDDKYRKLFLELLEVESVIAYSFAIKSFHIICMITYKICKNINKIINNKAEIKVETLEEVKLFYLYKSRIILESLITILGLYLEKEEES